MLAAPIENEHVKFWVEDGVLYAVYKSDFYDLEAARSCIDLRLKHADGTPMPALVDSRKIKRLSKEAREFFASDYACQHLKAAAMVIDSVVGKVTGNFFLNISKPVIPTKLFTSFPEAEKWVRQFVDK